MRASVKPAAVALAAVAASLLQPVALAGAGTVTLRADEWCPYNCAPAGDHPGYAVEIAREVFAAAGDGVDYQILGWARSVEDGRLGRHAGIIGAIPADAPDFVFPHEPIGASASGYAVRKGETFSLDDPDPFAGKVLGSIAGYAFQSEVGAYIEANKDDRSKVQLVSGDDALAQNLRKLAAGRVDVVVDDVNVLASAIAKAGLGDRIVIADRSQLVPIFIAFSPAIPEAGEYARRLSDGIVRLRASGRLAEILKPYGVADWR